MLQYNPIMVNENMEVIDGQHRLLVAEANHLPIYYVVVPGSGIPEVLELNVNVKKWQLADFVDSLIIQGYKEMAWLKEFCAEYGFSYSSGMILLNGTAPKYAGDASAALKRMTFTDLQKENARKAADLISVILQYKSKKGRVPRSLFYAALSMTQEKKDKRLADAIKARGKMVAFSNDTHEMIKILESYIPF